MTFLTALMLLAGLYIGWNLGANDGANSMGTAVGAGVRTIREAVLIVAIFGFLGAVFMGSHVIGTIGEDIVPLHAIDEDVAAYIGLAAMFGGGLWLSIATFLRLPVSTTHSVVGAVAGAGLAADNVPITWGRLLDVFVAWLVTPLGAALLAYILYRLACMILPHYNIPNSVWAWLLTISGMYMAFSWGGNDVANATAILSGTGIVSPLTATVLGGIAIAAGVTMLGYRVIETVGKGIVALAPPMAFVAEMAAALNIQLYTLLGIPVSTTHAIVGAIFGVGLVHGHKAVNKRTVRDIILAWATTPLCAGIVAFLLYTVMTAKAGGG